MTAKSAFVDRSRDMEETAWWNLWNTSYRVNDNNDAISHEHFVRMASIINGVIQKEEVSLLEVGCGTGTLSRMLTCSKYHGIDLSPAAVEVAGEKLPFIPQTLTREASKYEVADFHVWPLPDEQFDVTICIDAIAFFRDQAFVMRKIAESVRTNGIVVISTINRFVYERIRRVGGVRLESGPVSKWLSRRELHDLIRSANLTIEHSETIMPRGNKGVLRLLNSPRLNRVANLFGEARIKRMKEKAGLGQYSVVIARKCR